MSAWVFYDPDGFRTQVTHNVGRAIPVHVNINGNHYCNRMSTALTEQG